MLNRMEKAGQPAAAFRPAVDIQEMEREFLVEVDLPGVAPEDLDVRYEDGALYLYGKVPPREREGARELLREYEVGDYARAFRLGEQIDANALTAECKDGVATLHLPKLQALQPRKIEVKPA